MPRTIFIPDAASPLGRACAVRLGRAGWNVVMGASSLSSLKSVCDELPDQATRPHRCIPTEVGNIAPIIEAAEADYGCVDAVLMNYRPRRKSRRRILEGKVSAFSALAESSYSALLRSEGSFIVTGCRSGSHGLNGAIQTVTGNAMRTLTEGLSQDWANTPIQVSLIEPGNFDGQKPMARQIARVLNGAPARRTKLTAQRRANV